jgi:hypothetical protein
LRGAFSGAVFGGIGGHYGNTWNWERVGANTLGGGITSKVSGGNFADGAKLSFALSVTKLGFEKMKAYTDKLKYRACASNSSQHCKYLENRELDTTGTRGEHPSAKKGVNSYLGRAGMKPEWEELNRDGPLGSYKIKPYKFFLNDTSKVHDFFNSWHYDQTNGHFSPIYSRVGAELFEVYSFAGMPIAATYTAASYLAPYPVSGFKDLMND